MSSGLENREDEEGSSAIDTHTLNPNAAKLAADEGAFLDSIHDREDHLKQDELADWIGGILGEDLNPSTLFDDLSNGVRLLYLAKSINLIKCAHLKDVEYEEAVENLHPEEFVSTDHLSSKRASLIAKRRSNIAKFLEWCRKIGLPTITLFETSDLTQKKNLRQVTTCLFYVSRIAARFGIEPPSSVKEYMEKEETRSLEKKAEETLASKRRSSTGDTIRLISTKEPIYEQDEDELLASPVLKQSNLGIEIENYHRRSTPSSVGSDAKCETDMRDKLKPISPVELKFEGEDRNSDMSGASDKIEKTHFHFAKKPYIEDVEIRETTDMVIVEETKFRPVSVPRDQHDGEWDDTLEVRISPMLPDENENTRERMSTSSNSSSSSDENEYHTARDIVSYDTSGIMYQTAFVDDDSDEELENSPHLLSSYENFEERIDMPVTLASSGEIPDISDVASTSPYSLYRVPADIVVERHQKEEYSSDESTTDVESYVSNDLDHEVTFADVGVGTDDAILIPDDFITKENEIMIDFPPYFEIATKEDFLEIPPPEYVVAPVRNDAVYAMPKKMSSRPRQARSNPAFEPDTDSQSSRPSRDYASVERRPDERSHQITHSSTIPASNTLGRNGTESSQSEKGTQTHVSLTQDIVRIINELDDETRIGTTSSSASSRQRYSGGTTVVVRTQYQRTLPNDDQDNVISQAPSVENSRPPRWGSVGSSTRHRNRDPESAPERNETRRSLMRRASSAISEQFEKAVIVAKKYKKEISIVLVLLILTIGTLAAMLAVFPLT